MNKVKIQLWGLSVVFILISFYYIFFSRLVRQKTFICDVTMRSAMMMMMTMIMVMMMMRRRYATSIMIPSRFDFFSS